MIPGKETEGRESIGLICRRFQETGGQEERRTVRHTGDTGELLSSLSSPYKASWSQQFRALLWRNWMTVVREPLIMKVRITQAVVSSLKVLIKKKN